MDSEENEVESSSDAGPSGMEEPSESGMGMESSEAMSADSSDAAASHTLAPESDCHVGQSSEGLVVFIPETSSSTDARVSSVHLPDSSSVAQSTSVSSVSTVTQSVLVSESAQVLVHSSAVSDGTMMVSDSTASTSSDLGSAIDKIIESTIGPDIMNGCIAVTSAEDGAAETTQYLILQGPDDGAPMVAQMSSSALSGRIALEALSEGPTSTCLDQRDLQRNLEPDQPDDQPGHSGYPEDSSNQPDQPQHSHPSQYMDCSTDGPDQTGESSSSYVGYSGEEPDQTRSQSGFPDYSGDNSDQDLPGYVECSGADSNPTSHGHYVVECSAGYREQTHHLRSYIDSSADHKAQSSRQYGAEYGECADSEQPGCSRYQARDEDDDEQIQDPDQPQHSQQPAQHSCYTENSNGPEASLYADESSSSDHPVVDTAGSCGLPEALECSESQPGPYISSSGTYTAHSEPEPTPQCSHSQEEHRGSQGPQHQVEMSQEMDTSILAHGSGDRPLNLAELEEMMEVVIVQQFKCKICPYKSASKDTLINHMRDKHFKPAGDMPKKRKRGRPPKSETMARRQAELERAEQMKAEQDKAAQPQPAEEEEDDIVDAGAIDDSEEDSDYNPIEEDSKGRPPCLLKRPMPPISSSQGRPKRKVGRPRKYTPLEEGYSSKEADSITKVPRDTDTSAHEEASSSGLDSGPAVLIKGDTAETAISQSDSENKDPSSNSQPDEEFFPRKRGRPSKRFLRKKYKKYINRSRYYKSLKPLLRPHNCWICGSRFLTQEDLRFHVDSHEGNDPELFKCLHCNYHCKRWTSLKEHMFNHEGTKPFKCEECDYTSVYRKDVIRHSAVHKKEKRKPETAPKVSEFPCPICHKIYPLQKRLTQHMKTHSSEKPHMCDKCGKSFKKRYTFKMHLLTHIQSLGDSKFKCEFCEYTCDNKRLVLNHQLSHTNDRPFKCDYCKYATAKEEFLVSHMAIKHTGEKPFSCNMCHFMTKHRKNLRLHVQCRHPEAFDEWSVAHPEEPVRKRRKPFFTLQQIEELKQQHENTQSLHNTIVAVDSSTLQAIQGMENATVTQDALGNTIIYEQGESGDFSAQNALDLLLNMSNARELVGNSLQVAVLNPVGKEKGTWTVTSAPGTVATTPGPAPKIVTVHVSENGETVLQEAYEAPNSESGEITQITIGEYEGGGDCSVVEHTHTAEVAEQVHSPGNGENKSSEVSGSENVKGDKYYISSALPEGVLQQVELSSDAPSSPSAGSSPGLNTKRFSCRICMESFQGRSDMENHKRAHIDPNTFKCPDCDFTSASWPEVKSHMELHSYLRPHKCPNCSFASKNKKDLRRHIMTHTNEKPFSCKLCGQRFKRNGHLKFHMERLHNQDNPTRKSNSSTSQTIIVNSDEEALATLQSLQGQTVITPERLQALGQEHIIVSQEQAGSDQEEGTYIQQITIDGQAVQHLMTEENQVTEVQYIIAQDGVSHLIPQEYVVVADGNHIQMPDGQIIQYTEHEGAFVQGQKIAVSHNGQIQYLPVSSEQQIVNAEDLEAAAHSAVTAVADAAMAQTQTVYTEATPEQLEQLHQQGIHYDVITFTDE